jgi:hypothetical protein
MQFLDDKGMIKGKQIKCNIIDFYVIILLLSWLAICIGVGLSSNTNKDYIDQLSQLEYKRGWSDHYNGREFKPESRP